MTRYATDKCRPLALKAQIPDHGIIRGHEVEVRDTLRPDGALMWGHNDVLDWEAVGVLHPDGNVPRLVGNHLKGRPAPR